MVRPPTTANPEHVAPPESAFLLAESERDGFLQHFGFRETPFGVTPDPEFLFWSKMHRYAFQGIVSSIESNLGFSVLIGEPGTGKTTLLFELLNQYRARARTAFIFQTQCRANDLMRHIASELDLPCTRRDEVFLHQGIKAMLIQEARAGRKVIIMIDEAQNLQPSSLEAVRLLSGFETAPCKLLHVILAGSPRLSETLLSPDLSQLAQRITMIHRLEPLTELEIDHYLKFRLGVAGAEQPDALFSSEALAEMAFQSRGVPRLLNILGYRALLRAYRRGEQSISAERVNEASKDIDLTESGRTVSIEFQEPENSRLSSLSDEYTRAAKLKMAVRDTYISKAKPPQRNIPEQTRVAAVPANPRSSQPLPEMGALRREMRAAPAHANPCSQTRVASRSGNRISRDIYLSPIFIAAVVLLTLSLWMAWTRLHEKFAANSERSHAKTPESLNVGTPGATVPTEKAAHASRIGENNLTVPLIASDKRQHDATRAQGDLVIDFPSDSEPPSRINTHLRNSSELTPPSSQESISMASGSGASPPFDIRSSLPSPKSTGVVDSSAPVQPTAPRLEQEVKPDYPLTAKLRHIEGEVRLEIAIDQNGKVAKVRPLSGHPVLIEAAELAVRQWRYSPSTRNQLPVPAVTQVRFDFKLNPEAGK